MKRRFPPQLVFDQAVKLTGCEINLIRNTPGERSPAIVFAREAVIGAMREVTCPQPSWLEIAAYFGKMNHSSVHQAHGRFQRWFPRLQHAWRDMVRDACESPASDFEPQLTITPPYSLRGEHMEIKG